MVVIGIRQARLGQVVGEGMRPRRHRARRHHRGYLNAERSFEISPLTDGATGSPRSSAR